jgi:hypothetical protein
MNWYDKIVMLSVNTWQTSFGQTGQNLTISDTAAKSGNWTAVQMLSDTVISSITIDGATDAGIAGVASHGAGTIIYGKITAITLTSGTVRMYGGNNATLPVS